MMSKHCETGKRSFYDLGSSREMMIKSATTTTARIPQNITPPWPAAWLSRHEDFFSCSSGARVAVA